MQGMKEFFQGIMIIIIKMRGIININEGWLILMEQHANFKIITLIMYQHIPPVLSSSSLQISFSLMHFLMIIITLLSDIKCFQNQKSRGGEVKMKRGKPERVGAADHQDDLLTNFDVKNMIQSLYHKRDCVFEATTICSFNFVRILCWILLQIIIISTSPFFPLLLISNSNLLMLSVHAA